jgi:hypothetical protein
MFMTRTEGDLQLITDTHYTQFSRLFSFNTPCHLTSDLNLRTLIFGLTPSGWLRSITLTAYFLWEYYFLFRHYLFMSIFSGTQLWCKTWPGCPAHRSERRS